MTEWLHFHFSLSCIGEGNGNPLQCSCLENPRDGGAWWLPSMGSHRVRHDWSDLAVAAANYCLDMLDSIIDLMDTNLSKLQEIVKDRGAWHAAVHGITKSQTRLSDWRTTTTKLLSLQILFPSHFYLLFSWDPVISKIHYTLYIYASHSLFSIFSLFVFFTL